MRFDLYDLCAFVMYTYTQSHSQTKDHDHWCGSETSHKRNHELASGQYTLLAQSFPIVVGKVYEHHIGKALHSATYTRIGNTKE